MMLLRALQGILAASAFTFGILGTVKWSDTADPLAGFIRGDFPITASIAAATEARSMARRASCAVVRFYIAKYGTSEAEALARSKGATEVELQGARHCMRTAEAPRGAT